MPDLKPELHAINEIHTPVLFCFVFVFFFWGGGEGGGLNPLKDQGILTNIQHHLTIPFNPKPSSQCFNQKVSNKVHESQHTIIGA